MEVIGFFKRLYSLQLRPKVIIPLHFLPRISQAKVDALERMPTKGEIRAALRSCDPFKAVVYDGFNFNFIKKMWGEFEEEI